MARAATKEDLQQSASEGFAKLMQLLDRLGSEEQEAPFAFTEDAALKEAHWHRDRNVRDVLIHLYEWHQLLLSWVKANMGGAPQPFLPAPYNWKTYGDMNVELWRKHQHTPLSDAYALLRQSHSDVMSMIAGMSNEELFAKGHFSWTGGTTLGSYCISATSSHYDWAMKKVRKHRQTLAQGRK